MKLLFGFGRLASFYLQHGKVTPQMPIHFIYLGTTTIVTLKKMGTYKKL